MPSGACVLSEWWFPNFAEGSPNVNRELVVQMYSNPMIDIGFVNSCEDLKTKNVITIKEQLKSKFLISVEGGDVATNLKWILYSNSTPLMAKPTMASCTGCGPPTSPWPAALFLRQRMPNCKRLSQHYTPKLGAWPGRIPIGKQT